MALPQAEEQCEPYFVHYDQSALPVVRLDNTTTRVLVGEAFGVVSAVKAPSPTLYVEAQPEAGGRIALPDGWQERAVYVVAGSLQTQGTTLPRHTLAVFDQSPGIELEAREPSRLVIIGGTPLGKRIVWWNLVACRNELIEQAKRDWRVGAFAPVPGETEFIPLPE